MGGKMSRLWYRKSRTDDGSAGDANATHKSVIDSVGPFILTRHGSMFMDTDGDVAHEFYEQIFDENTGHMVMVRLHDVKPQGDVKLDIPRLNVNLPMVMYEVAR